MKFFSLSKKPAMKRLFGTKSKRSSKTGKVGILKSHLVKDMKIECENDDSGDYISDGDAESLYCTGLLSHDKHGEKWTQCEVLSLSAWRLWG